MKSNFLARDGKCISFYIFDMLLALIVLWYHYIIISYSEYNKKSTEIEALGSQTLFDLINHFHCFHDFSIFGVRGSIFFIEDVFYVEDINQDGVVAASALLIIEKLHNWIFQDISPQQNSNLIPNDSDVLPHYMNTDLQTIGFKPSYSNKRKNSSRLRKFSITNCNPTSPDIRSVHTPLADLNFAPGKKYLYLHKGGCEHFMYFSNIRTYSRVRDLGVSAYPKTTLFELLHRRKCGVCDAISAKYVVFGDKMVDTNPFYFCEHCFFQLHYTDDGSLIYNDFHVFPYQYDLV